ncbi:MAG: META domain-containing protein [Anaerolineae bacterium]
MRIRRQLLIAGLLVGLVAITGCVPAATPSAPGAAPAIPLEGTTWLLSAIGGESVLAGTAPTLSFHPDNYLEANSGCNYLGVDYGIDGNAFTLAEIHRTQFDCEAADVAAQDATFFEAFQQIAAYGATEDALVFQDARGVVILEYARKRPPVVDPALLGSEWLLVTLGDVAPLPGTRITLSFGPEGLGGISGCNHYGGAYAVASEGALELEQVVLTAMLCLEPEGVMEQEQAFMAALDAVAGYRTGDDRLEILGADGGTLLTFSRQPTFDTDPAALIGTAWHAIETDGEPVASDVPLTLVFYREGILGGQAGCRDFIASAQMNGDALTLPFMAMLDPGCDPQETALDQESALLGVLSGRAAVELTGERLVLHGERGGTVVLEPLFADAARPIEGTAWSLLGFAGPNELSDAPVPLIMADGLIPGTTIDLMLADDQAAGSAGCNRYFSGYTLKGDVLAISAVGATKMACQDPAGLMTQESRYLEMLQAATTARVYSDRLWLETADGRALLFAAQ